MEYVQDEEDYGEHLQLDLLNDEEQGISTSSNPEVEEESNNEHEIHTTDDGDDIKNKKELSCIEIKDENDLHVTEHSNMIYVMYIPPNGIIEHLGKS